MRDNGRKLAMNTTRSRRITTKIAKPEQYSCRDFIGALSGDMEVMILAAFGFSIPTVDSVKSHNFSTGC